MKKVYVTIFVSSKPVLKYSFIGASNQPCSQDLLHSWRGGEEVGLDTKIPKNGLKIYPGILQKMAKTPPQKISKFILKIPIYPNFFFEIIT